jgi:glycosyltransferase involved in cell wall biosynthesis
VNLLFLNTYPAWGGGETWMLDVADGLRARGHHCLIAGRPGWAWFDRTRELGWNPIVMNIRGEFAPLICMRLRRLYRAAAVDVVVCNFSKEVRLAGAARFGSARPAIVNMKGLPLISDTLRHRLGYRHIIDHTVVCAEFIREEYRRHPWAKLDKISVIYNCYKPPSSRIAPSSFREELKIPQRHLVVGAVARCDYRKGLQDLIAAAPGVLAVCPETTFVIVGDGSERTRLQDQAAQAGAGERIIFSGFRFDMDSVFDAFDLFVLPSHHEGFPYVTQIAMHHAKAIVATRVGAVPEAITDGVNGVLVDPKSPGQLAAAITTLLRDPSLRTRLGKEAEATLRTRFSYEGMIVHFEELFRGLVRQTNGGFRGAR